MLLTISKYVGIIMRKNGICNSDEIEKVEYGTVVLLSTLIGFGSIFIIGLIFGKLLETLVFSLIFSILRSFTGGYHAATPRYQPEEPESVRKAAEARRQAKLAKRAAKKSK